MNKQMIIAAFVLFAVAANSSLLWADSESTTKVTTVTQTTGPEGTPNLNGGPNDEGYANKDYHSATGRHIYKHPGQPSFTSPFDYGNDNKTRTETVTTVTTGKCNCFIFDATKSYDIGGQKLTVMWDFGDGQTSDQPVIQHCFDKAGVYNVTLTVRGSSGTVCDTGVSSTKVDANFPFQASAGAEQVACLGEAVTFTGSNTSNSNPVNAAWDFGDGETAQGGTVTHTYKQPGQYRVRLTVDDGKKTVCSVAVASTTARIFQNANVTITGVESACVGRTLAFDAQGTGGKYHWDFGDGETWDGGNRASHTFNKVGTHNVSVTVDDGRGSKCSTASAAMKVNIGAPPVAKISETTSCLVSEAVNFDGSTSTSSVGNLTYHWNFGDGEAADGTKVAHTFKKAGTYRVALTVGDSSGGDCGMASDSIAVTVNTRPESVITVR